MSTRGKYINIAGQRFGKLTALSFVGTTKQCDRLWFCQCDCGASCEVRASKLRSSHTQSCGCLQKERARVSHLRHGLANTKLYKVWLQMKSRCSNENNAGYEYYGARGITVCEEWQNFASFYQWAMSNGYKEGLSIERIDNGGDYKPSNCSWATRAIQSRNKRNNIILTFNGETRKLVDWADTLGISPRILRRRMRLGWSTARVLTQPVRSVGL